MFGRLVILNAFSTYDSFNLHGFIEGNPVSGGASVHTDKRPNCPLRFLKSGRSSGC